MSNIGSMKLPSLLLVWLSLLPAGNASAQDGQAFSSSSATSIGGINVDAAPHRDSWQVDNGHEIVVMGGDATLQKGKRADTVVSILGSSSSDGEVDDNVVSVLGNTRVTGPVGGSVVAVLGNTYVNSRVDDEVVAVLGDVELGPLAEVNGQVVAVGGKIVRDPAATLRGGEKQVALGFKLDNVAASFAWLQPWIDHCFKQGRLLAWQPGLTWAWWVAILSLLSYVLTAWLAPRSVERCVLALEHHPGRSLLAALLGAVLSPMLIMLLLITVIGILAVPLVALALLTLDMFGRLVMLAWLGRRVLRTPADQLAAQVAWLTLIGGVLVTLLYLVPVLGFIVYKLIGFVGFGAVLYALLLNLRSKRQVHTQAHTRAWAPAGNTAAADAADASFAAMSEPEQGTSTNSSDAPPNEPPPAAAPGSGTSLLALPRAGFWERMGALLIDVVLVMVVTNLVLHADNLGLLALAVYGAVMWKLKGSTIGGMVFNLRLLRVDGRALDWSTASVRALSCFLSLLVAGLGFIWIAIDEERQAWHDKIAGTVVVRTPKSVSLV